MDVQKGKLKPMLKIKEMIECLKQKNIKFEEMSEKDAEEYLRYNNNYYNVTAYKIILRNIQLQLVNLKECIKN